MDLHPSEVALLRDLALAKSSWTSAASEAISNPQAERWIENEQAWSKLSSLLRDSDSHDAFVAVVSELLSGLMHSVLVTLDGGSALAESTLLTVQDEKGHEFKKFLHEFWPHYANDTEA
jgi:hypothetical protein